MIYEFADHATRIASKLDAQKVGEELERLRIKNNGHLDKKQVIECAQDGTSPLHNAFTWDDAKAAHAYRLRQAQNLIAAVVIVDDQTGESTKAFWSISVKAEDNEEQRQGRYYQSVRVLKESPQEYASALKMALMELESSEITLQQLKRIAPDKEHVKIDKAAAHILDAHDLLYQSPSIGATV